ncbi:MAG: hypothetical protein OXG27_08840 [Chloroflexi bacterium]|nr:hypothetical protein [Chloroflexota bacterium]
MPTNESTELALKLLRQLTDTVEQLADLSDDDLAFPTEHGCAMAGGLERLLVHNAEHDRMHAGAVSTARFTAKQMQESQLAHLTRDLLHVRMELVSQLLNMDDALLDAKGPADEWSIREHVEHVLYWENSSMSQVASEMKAQAGSAAAGGSG